MSLSSAIGVTSAVTFRSEAVTELGQAMHELIARQIDLGEFTDRFLAARIYTLCPVRPGLFVMSRPGGVIHRHRHLQAPASRLVPTRSVAGRSGHDRGHGLDQPLDVRLS